MGGVASAWLCLRSEAAAGQEHPVGKRPNCGPYPSSFTHEDADVLRVSRTHGEERDAQHPGMRFPPGPHCCDLALERALWGGGGAPQRAWLQVGISGGLLGLSSQPVAALPAWLRLLSILL